VDWTGALPARRHRAPRAAYPALLPGRGSEELCKARAGDRPRGFVPGLSTCKVVASLRNDLDDPIACFRCKTLAGRKQVRPSNDGSGRSADEQGPREPSGTRPPWSASSKPSSSKKTDHGESGPQSRRHIILTLSTDAEWLEMKVDPRYDPSSPCSCVRFCSTS